jgi:hypothetical protein
MSLLIENTDELLTVVKKLNLKVASVDELRHLLAEINANYNPEAARQKTGKLIGVTVPSALAAAAAGTSFFVVATGNGMTPYHVAALALIWGACAFVSFGAVLASAIMTSTRRGGRVAPESTPDRRNLFAEGITKELP